MIRRLGAMVVAIVVAFGVIALLLWLVDAPPLEAMRLLWQGSFGSWEKAGNTLMAWVPLVLASAGLVVTFAAGMWNIGVEGQIILGAIAATCVARVVPGSGALLVPLCMAAGIVGGMAWALLAGVLRTRGRVNEIFGGLGLDFVATGLVIYLILGPWKRAGIASTSGTDLFRTEAWLPTLRNSNVSVIAILVALVAVVLVAVLMRGSRFGLRLKAVGSNARSAFLMGIPTNRYLLAAFAFCGGLAGLAGSFQATGVHHKLVPAVSGGWGFLGILVVLLAGFRAAWIAPIALFFAAISVGGTQLQLRLNLDSALAGVIQGILVLAVLLARGWQEVRSGRRAAGEAPPQAEIVPEPISEVV
jgi:general nucleoside transport system permease protein